MKNMKKSIFRICVIAMMAAMYFVLAHFLTIRLGKSQNITFASLPIILTAALFGPWEAVIAAFLGEFLNQMLTYGLSVTLPLWLLPPMIRGLIAGIGCKVLRGKNPAKKPWETPVPYEAVLLIAAVLTTIVNTGVMWIDGLIGHYTTKALVLLNFLSRLGTGILTALIVTAVSIPILTALTHVLKEDRD